MIPWVPEVSHYHHRCSSQSEKQKYKVNETRGWFLEELIIWKNSDKKQINTIRNKVDYENINLRFLL